MDWKVKNYQSFCGDFLQTTVKISQKIVDKMSDSDLMALRSAVSDSERRIFSILSHYAQQVVAEHEQTETETETETSEESDDIPFSGSPESSPESITSSRKKSRSPKPETLEHEF